MQTKTPHLTLVSSTRNLREALHAEMIKEYAQEQRNFARFRLNSIHKKLRTIDSLVAFSGLYVWEWTPQLINTWASDPARKRWSTNYLRARLSALKDFNDFAADPASEWPERIIKAFNIVIRQNVTLRRVPKHGHDGLSKKRRPWTEDEIEKMLAHLLQNMIGSAKNGRRGKIASARDYTMFVLQLAYGLRAQELSWIAFCDILKSPDPEPTELFGDIGALNIRYPKAYRGQEPLPGVVASVPLFVTHVETFQWYLTHVRPTITPAEMPPTMKADDPKRDRYDADKVFLTDVGTRMEPGYWGDRLKHYIIEIGLDPDLVSHDCRHYYATRLQENDYDFEFVREQLRHANASSTAKYTWISDSFRRSRVRRFAQEELARRKA